MKKIVTLILLFLTIISFSQNIEYIKASNLSDNKKYVEANVLFEKLLRNEFGLIDNETRFFILSTVADNYYRLKDFQNSYDYYNITIDFVNKNHIHKELLKDIISLSEFIKTLVSSKKSNSTEVTDAAKDESKKTSDTNPVNGNTAFYNSNKQADKKETNTDKTFTLTVSGTGKTLEEAKTNALRSAIEQAFGAFISSKTEILNDNLVKDEIVSVANGNIQKFEIISQVEIPNNGYAMTLKATVSISKLTSFAQSKGVSVEIKGGLFAANIIQQELNEKAELISLKNILNTSNELLKKSFDYSIETKGNPTLNNGKYDIPLKITVKLNKNFYEFRKYFINSLNGLSMSESEIANYEEIKKPLGQLIVRKDTLTFQENMKKLKYRNVAAEWSIDINNFDENTEKILYTWGGKWTYQVEKFAPYSYFEAQRNNELNKVFEIKSLKELKNIFGKGWLGSTQEPVDMIIYKVNKNDLGYSKIYFRNKSSLSLVNVFLIKYLKKQIFNFEIKNNLNTILGRNIEINENIKSFAKISLKACHYSGESIIQDLINNNDEYDSYRGEDCFSDCHGKFNWNYFMKLGFKMKYFPNLLSISPLKIYSQNMIVQFSYFNENNEILNIDYIDTKSLEEIKQLTEYKIKPKE